MPKVILVDPEERSIELTETDLPIHVFAEVSGIGDPGGYAISPHIALFCDDLGRYTVPEENWFLVRGHGGWIPGKTVFYRCDDDGMTISMTERDLSRFRRDVMFRQEGVH